MADTAALIILILGALGGLAAGIYCRKPVIRFAAYGFLACALLCSIYLYPQLKTPELFLTLNILYACFSFGFFFIYLSRNKIHAILTPRENTFILLWLAPLTTVINTMWWRDWIEELSAQHHFTLVALYLTLGIFHVLYGAAILLLNQRYSKIPAMRLLGWLITSIALYYFAQILLG